MRRHRTRSRRRSRADLEQLLDGAGGPAAAAPLGELIEAASAAGHDDELSGLTPALAAFRSAGDPSPAAADPATAAPDARTSAPARRRSLLKPALSGILATKIIAAAASAAAVGGIALAASTGHLPSEGHHAMAPSAASSTSHPGQSPGAGHSTDRDRSAAAARSSVAASGSSGPASVATSSNPGAGPPARILVRLCHAWRAHEHDPSRRHDRWMRSRVFAALVSAAGTRPAVDGYCRTLLVPAARPSGSAPPTYPTHPVHPTHPGPSGRPTSPAAPPTYPSHPVRPTHPGPSGSPTSPAAPPIYPSHPVRPSPSPTPSPTAG